MKKPIDEMKLQFTSRSWSESFARVAVTAFLARMDPTLDEIADIKTAVSEAVTNCIVHAYPGTLGPVYIHTYLYDDDRVVIKIRDRGCGIEDVELALQPMYTTAPGDERAGLGFAVMTSFMDKLRVRSRMGTGTTVTMEKKLSGRKQDG